MYMWHMYSHPGNYMKILLADYLCIGFVPGRKRVTFDNVHFFSLNVHTCVLFQLELRYCCDVANFWGGGGVAYSAQ